MIHGLSLELIHIWKCLWPHIETMNGLRIQFRATTIFCKTPRVLPRVFCRGLWAVAEVVWGLDRHRLACFYFILLFLLPETCRFLKVLLDNNIRAFKPNVLMCIKCVCVCELVRQIQYDGEIGFPWPSRTSPIPYSRFSHPLHYWHLGPGDSLGSHTVLQYSEGIFCRVFGSVPGLSPLDARSILSLEVVTAQMSPGTVKCCLVAESTPVETLQSRRWHGPVFWTQVW